MFGIGKAAVMPLHRWLPAAMVAPTPVSALLHAVAVVKAGVFTIVKVIVFVFGIDMLVAAGVDWLRSSPVHDRGRLAGRAEAGQPEAPARLFDRHAALLRRARRRLLAPLSVIGAALHIAAHAFGKITLFFAAGSIYTAAHKTEVSSSTASAVACPGPWARSPSARSA